jgi:hypothetical protein
MSAAAGHRRIEPAMVEPPIDLAEDLRECWGGDARKHPAAGRETPVRANQMFAPRSHAG